MRLASFEVKRLLARGQRQNASAASVTFSSRTLPRDGEGDTSHTSRLAVAVPKRLLKRAVDRNRAKRVLRETFRLHDVRTINVDTLITLTSTPKPKSLPRRAMMVSLRAAAEALYGKVILKRREQLAGKRAE